MTPPAPEDPGTDTEAHLREPAAVRDCPVPPPPAPPGDDPAASDDAPPAETASPVAGDAAEELARLREELIRQKLENARLTRLTSLYGGSGGGSPPAPARRFDELSEREMEVELRRQARGLDGF